jgi:lipopolysaccharide/colanic/teichoic acid biosynthesis glycosyltransferase
MAADGVLRTAALERPALRSDLSKRALDLALGGALLLAAAPLMLGVGLIVRLTHQGSVLFWQRRIGLHGRPFWFPKFRSMHEGADQLWESLRPFADHPGSVTFKMKSDPRITPVGRALRTLSLDELPQLWCVVRGDMSLVGPRPPLPDEALRYGAEARRRLAVKPGLTCLWQVRGRSLLGFDAQLALDLEYIERQSLGLDLAILAQTLPAVLSCRGAY